jgi:HK97 family phage major capsid protein
MEILEKRDALLAEVKNMIETAKSEERAFTDDEQRAYDEKVAEIENLNNTAKAELRSRELESSLVNVPTVEEEREEADQMEEFRSFLRLEKRDVAFSEGVFAPTQFVTELLSELDKLVFVRQRAKKYLLTKQESITLPIKAPRMGAATWGEAGVAADTDLGFQSMVLKPEVLNTLVKVSKKLLKVSALPIEAEVMKEMAYSMASTLEQAYMTGDGADNTPHGIFDTTAIDTSADVTVGSGITAESFIAAKNKMMYNNPVWVIHPDVLTEIESLKSGDNYIFMPSFREGQPDTILGIPVIRSEFAPSATTAGSYIAALVDWAEAYVILDVAAMETQILNELYAEANQVGYKGFFITGGAPVNPWAVKRIKVG